MLQRLFNLLIMLLIMAVVTACGQSPEQDSSMPETVNSISTDKEEQHPDSKRVNDESASDEVFSTQAYNQDEVVYFEENGFSFSYPDYIGGEVRSEVVAASDEEAFLVYPEHKLFTYNDYLLKDTMIKAQIQIFPLDKYLALNDYNAEAIDLTRKILNGHSMPEEAIEMPYVPYPMAAQMLYAKFKITESQAGKGFRYITQYGQDVGPVTNDYIFYTYQGITADGQYYISATFPVYHSELPSDFEDYFSSSGIDQITFEEGYPEYLDAVVQMLNQAGDDEYIPALGMLDSIMTSMVYE